ncbi:MAG: flavodoxin family protein [Sedimentisphaerales bacterium]|nr:flavodoxin family protein [Sedimentisphaerales bacterium]
MKSILGIIGSPRPRGNTHLLVESVLAGGADAGGDTRLLPLGSLRIAECDGCHACWRQKPCPKADDMNEIYPVIEASDVLVFGTPVYWYGPTALMKAFIDRFVYFNCPAHRGGIRGKAAAVAIAFEEADPKIAQPLVDFFQRCFDYLELSFAGTILAPGVTKKGEIRTRPEILDEAYALGKSLAG